MSLRRGLSFFEVVCGLWCWERREEGVLLEEEEAEEEGGRGRTEGRGGGGGGCCCRSALRREEEEEEEVEVGREGGREGGGMRPESGMGSISTSLKSPTTKWAFCFRVRGACR
jgi:hypothetical protein